MRRPGGPDVVASPRLDLTRGNRIDRVGIRGASVVTPAILPIIVSSEIVRGPNRFLFTLTDRANKPIAAADVPVRLDFYAVGTAPDTVAFRADARFLPTTADRGLYVADVTFPDAGRWGTRFTANLAGREETVRADYDVAETGSSTPLGAAAPSVKTPTLASVGGDVKLVSTDDDPVARLYETSVDQALAAHKAFVLVFATPAFCRTQTCGPALDIVKSVAGSEPATTFINVEPYQMTSQNGALQPVLDATGQLQTAPWTDAYGLVTEPFTFVVDAAGIVRAKFEGVAGVDELRDAIRAVQR